jgi:hypothetical protein
MRRMHSLAHLTLDSKGYAKIGLLILCLFAALALLLAAKENKLRNDHTFSEKAIFLNFRYTVDNRNGYFSAETPEGAIPPMKRTEQNSLELSGMEAGMHDLIAIEADLCLKAIFAVYIWVCFFILRPYLQNKLQRNQLLLLALFFFLLLGGFISRDLLELQQTIDDISYYLNRLARIG